MIAERMPDRATRLPQVRMLADGRRLHLNDGPIDLIIEAFGPVEVVRRAYTAATARLTGLLDDLCAELPVLRRAAIPGECAVRGSVARRMVDAVAPYAAETFITPMAAVAGSVADTILAAIVAATGDGLERAYVNNGGDIAIHLASGMRFVTGLVTRPDSPSLFATVDIGADDGIRGIATSGAPGRSFSLGIADAVTILARDAATADAAATIVANAVDLPGDERIVRVPARDLQPDSDLGFLCVTRSVPALGTSQKDEALHRGVAVADRLVASGRIAAAALYLQGEARFVGSPNLMRPRIMPTTERQISLLEQPTGGAIDG
jgi:ApbE superfamily uncharacterized protein (UPF0280 family)